MKVTVLFIFIWRNVNGLAYVEGDGVYETWNDDTVVFWCRNGLSLAALTKERVRPVIPITKIDVIRCPPPEEPFAKIFKTIGIDMSAVTELTILDTPLRFSYGPSPFLHLSIEKLSITYSLQGRHGIISLAKDVFLPLTDTLLSLKLSAVLVPPFPQYLKVQNLTMERGESQSILGECEELRMLELTEWHVPEIEDGWLTECRMLQQLSLLRLTKKVARQTLNKLPGLQKLSVRHCGLDNLPETFRRGALLESLDLSHNKLVDVPTTLLESCTNLKHLNLSSNFLQYSWQFKYGLESLSALRVLDLHNNMDLDICGSNMVPHVVGLKVEYLYLQRTGTKYLCFKMWNTLKYLDVSESQLYLMGFQFLPGPQSHPVVVNLVGNKLISLPMSKEVYNETLTIFSKTKNTTVLLTMNIDCNCSNGIVAKALRRLEGRLNVVGLQCKEDTNTSIYQVAPGDIECDRWTCQDCECTEYWDTGHIFIECVKDIIHRIPTVERMYSVRAPNQLVRTLSINDLRDSLMDQSPYKVWHHLKGMISYVRFGESEILSLDLRDNRIQRLEPSVVHELFKVKGRRIRFTGNPLVCDCENWAMIEAMQTHKEQVIEYKKTWCSFAEETIFVGNITRAALCAAETERVVLVSTAAGGTFLSLLALAGIFVYRYWNVVKIYFFSRGWCIGCLQEDLTDSNREYDAFISYSHHDDEFVATELLPKLQDKYRLCVHTRDWVPGEMIPVQIVRSVNSSRRTVIILSRHFLTSVWGMMEFRTAHLRALREGRARVILIVLDDVIEDRELTEELRDYLRTNTYLKWQDPWFWKKLCYALPHKSVLSDTSKSFSNLLETDEFGGNDTESMARY